MNAINRVDLDISKLSEDDRALVAAFVKRLARTGASMKKGRSRQDYQTPPEFMAAVRKRFGDVAIDLAATAANAQADQYFGPGSPHHEDALAADCDWSRGPKGVRWLNCEFNKIKPWAIKCSKYSGRHPLLLLTPASVGAKWFTTYLLPHAHVLLLQPRLTFVGETDPYPKDCALSCFGVGNKGRVEPWLWKVS